MYYYKLALTKYADFKGRATRKEYWMFFLFNLIISIALGIVQSIISDGKILTSIYSLAILIPSIAVAVRRLQDTGKNGWWLLVGLIPFIGFIVLIVFLCIDSQPGANIYGPNPKEINSNSTTPTSPTTPPVAPTI